MLFHPGSPISRGRGALTPLRAQAERLRGPWPLFSCASSAAIAQADSAKAGTVRASTVRSSTSKTGAARAGVVWAGSRPGSLTSWRSSAIMDAPLRPNDGPSAPTAAQARHRPPPCRASQRSAAEARPLALVPSAATGVPRALDPGRSSSRFQLPQLSPKPPASCTHECQRRT